MEQAAAAQSPIGLHVPVPRGLHIEHIGVADGSESNASWRFVGAHLADAARSGTGMDGGEGRGDGG